MFSVDNLGSALRFLRVRRKRKQVEVAARANVTKKAMLSSYEIGHRLPSFKNLTAILNALFEDFHQLQEALDDGPSARYRPPAIRDPIKAECLGKALILLRTHRRLTQEAVANQAKVTKAMLSSYETGRRHPTLRSLAAVLGALKSDFHRLQEALLVVTREEDGHL
jgi:transcriptional regulator with XRE-family HTH domain